jgi:NitT/TauT family transport system permease protein
MAITEPVAPRRIPRRGAGDNVLLWQIVFGLAFFASWEWAAVTFGDSWTSRPSLIFARLGVWLAGPLYYHLLTTFGEIAIGLSVGIPLGALCGLWLGRTPLLGQLLRPFIVTLYSVPLITLAPLFVMWFGLEMRPKIVMIAVVVYFLLFFNTFRGTQTIDEDLIDTLRMMGANRREIFLKIVLPASTAWIMSGVKIALPYSLVAATVGEMLAARAGVGWLISRAAAQFDMASLYAALIVLMAAGLVLAQLATVAERRFLRWRHAEQ